MKRQPFDRSYLAEDWHAVAECFCAVLQQSIALLELVLASLSLFLSWQSAALRWCLAASSWAVAAFLWRSLPAWVVGMMKVPLLATLINRSPNLDEALIALGVMAGDYRFCSVIKQCAGAHSAKQTPSLPVVSQLRLWAVRVQSSVRKRTYFTSNWDEKLDGFPIDC